MKLPITRKELKRIKDAVVGADYDLSLVWASNSLSRKLNRIYRGKDKPTNVLSFPLSKTSGEIFLNLNLAKKEASEFEMNYREFVIYLFIHGLLHLNGLKHGRKMNQTERKFMKIFYGAKRRSGD